MAGKKFPSHWGNTFPAVRECSSLTLDEFRLRYRMNTAFNGGGELHPDFYSRIHRIDNPLALGHAPCFNVASMANM